MKSLEQELREGNYDINGVLNDKTSERRVILARMGHHIDILAQTLEPEVLIALIENGYAEDWSHHISSRVREALARKGYYPDHFLYDPSSIVQLAVIDAYSNRVAEFLSEGGYDHWRHIFDRVLEKQEPEVIKQFVNATVPVDDLGRYYDIVCE